MNESTLAPPERVASILDAACRVVIRDGAHGLRMASVAREAGVSKALVHYYFSTRQELMRHAFAWSERRWHAALGQEVDDLPNGAQKLERLLLASIDVDHPFGNQRALWNEVWSSLRYDETLRPLVDAAYRTWIERIVGLIEEGHRDGSVPPTVDPTGSAWQLAAIGDGLDSMLYLELLDRSVAHEVMLRGIRRELGSS